MTSRTAIVSGGSRGIGAAIAERLAIDGYDVAITYARNKAAAEKIVRKIEAHGHRGLALQADSGDVGDTASAVSATISAFGQIDTVICNAGVYPYGPFGETSVDTINEALFVNIRGAMLLIRNALAQIKPGGHIVMIGSAFGERAPFPNISVYAATKAALNGFAKGLSRDLGQRGITVNVVQPGPIDTELNPADGPAADLLRSYVALGQYGTTADIANLVSFLASPSAGNITGAILSSDGGITA